MKQLVLAQAFSRFDRMTLRERALVSAATLAAVVMTWMIAVLDPLSAKQGALSSELSSLQESIATTSQTMQSSVAGDATSQAIAREAMLQTRLEGLNAQLVSKSGGLIPPERMVQVIHDVLNRQHGVTLISLHNKPVVSLVQNLPAEKPTRPVAPASAETPADATTDAATNETAGAESTEQAPPASTGPYVHPVELVIEGNYLDVLAYLRALENLQWRFYWKVLELQTTHYPTSRVRIELSTLSMDKDWIGV
jgi:MSHA biogenesis protein MshJ